MSSLRELIDGSLLRNPEKWARNRFLGWRVLFPITLQLLLASLLIVCILLDAATDMSEADRVNSLIIMVGMAGLSAIVLPLFNIYALHCVVGRMERDRKGRE